MMYLMLSVMHRCRFMYKFVGGIVWGCTVFNLSDLYVHVYPMVFRLNCIGDVTVGPRPYFLLVVVS
jgi:hypothetical protein